MPGVLLFATTTGYQTRAFADAAARLGVELIYVTDRCDVLDDPWRDAAIPIRFHDEDASVAAVVRAAARRAVHGVIAVGDRPTMIASRVCAELGLPWHPPHAAAAARNKQLTRQALLSAGLRTPVFAEGQLADDPAPLARDIGYPAVLKPLALSGSRGVMRVNDDTELDAAIGRLRAILASADLQGERSDAHARVLLERFIPGREFAVEGLMTAGRLRVLAIFDKPDPLDGPFFEETIYCTPTAAGGPTTRAIVDTVATAADALGLAHGPLHAECRVNADGVFILEVAARPIGGLCARALRFVSRDAATHSSSDTAIMPFEELLLRHGLGEPCSRYVREPSASGVMMIPIPRRGVFRGVSGLDAARAVNGVEDVIIAAKPDQMLIPLPEGASYLGFIFARAAEVRTVESALRVAHSRLAFTVRPEVPMLQSTHG
jgi:formate-dependent phosphoribosylglycinamide formyltransferase (GAR transformylase)